MAVSDAGEIVSGDENGCVAIWLAPEDAIPKMLSQSTNTNTKVECVAIDPNATYLDSHHRRVPNDKQLFVVGQRDGNVRAAVLKTGTITGHWNVHSTT